jgi:hypothetical protein
MGAPIASVLMPVRDAVATVAEAVGSVLGQTLADLELVVVDDGSRDGTVERLRTAAASDPRVRVIERPREGLVSALNAGLATARAGLVARMDSDDVCMPGRLVAQVALLAARQDVDVAGCLVECFPREGLSDGMLRYEAWLNGVVSPEDFAREIYVESPLAHPSAVFRRDAVLSAGGYREGPFPEDYDLWLRLHAAGRRMAKVPEVLLRWRDGPGRLTRTDPRYSPGAFLRLKAPHVVAGFLRGGREVQVCGAGPDARVWGRTLAALGVRVVRHLDVDRRKVGRTVGTGAIVVHWDEVARHRDVPMVCAVGLKGARPRIRAELDGLGWREGLDYVFVQ